MGGAALRCAVSVSRVAPAPARRGRRASQPPRPSGSPPPRSGHASRAASADRAGQGHLDHDGLDPPAVRGDHRVHGGRLRCRLRGFAPIPPVTWMLRGAPRPRGAPPRKAAAPPVLRQTPASSVAPRRAAPARPMPAAALGIPAGSAVGGPGPSPRGRTARLRPPASPYPERAAPALPSAKTTPHWLRVTERG